MRYVTCEIESREIAILLQLGSLPLYSHLASNFRKLKSNEMENLDDVCTGSLILRVLKGAKEKSYSHSSRVFVT
jgi:hypothetical protein